MTKSASSSSQVEKQRLAKAISASGRASRRDAEKLIEAGRVSVNGKIVQTPVCFVDNDDEIRVDGEILRAPPLRLWLYHKPAGLVSTSRDEKSRRTVFDELPKVLGQVNTIGRLDLNSEGLLLLTNHGGLKRVLELPQTGWRRKYRVRAFGKVDDQALEPLRKGLRYEGVQYRPMEIVMDREQGDNAWYTVALREGKNREIRRAFEAVGLQVNRLIRVSYGPFQLGGLAKGEVSELRPKALRTLLGGLLPEGAELALEPLDLDDKDEAEPSSKPARKHQKQDKKSAKSLNTKASTPRQKPSRGGVKPKSRNSQKSGSKRRRHAD